MDFTHVLTGTILDVSLFRKKEAQVNGFKKTVQGVFIKINISSGYIKIAGDKLLDCDYSVGKSIQIMVKKGDSVTSLFAYIEEYKINLNDSVLLTVKLNNDYKKSQKRNYFRINIKKEILFKKLDDPSNSWYFEGQVLDLSGGGMRLKLGQPYEPGDLLLCEFEVEKTKVKVVSEVMWVQKTKSAKDNSINYITGANFVNLKNEDRDKIVKYIFNEERKAIKYKKKED